MRKPCGVICRRCVLDPNVPGVTLDDEQVCNVCRQFEADRSSYDQYFKSEGDLAKLLQHSHNPQGEYDVLLMYSGGKDSTYVLYRLLDLDQRILAVTFDNNFIPQGCFENIRGVCQSTNVDSMIVSLEDGVMDRVFRATLKSESAVCTGCFRALTARGTELAIEKNIPIVMTGLSRGQIVHTKIQQFIERGKTDPQEIDRWLRLLRLRYHAQHDEVATLLRDRSLENTGAFERVQFVDFFRYCDVAKPEIVQLIADRAPSWRVPANVGGCSSNCMINDVGIHVFQQANGYHYYAIPTAWEVRLGHLSREAALEELDAEMDQGRIQSILKRLEV